MSVEMRYHLSELQQGVVILYSRRESRRIPNLPDKRRLFFPATSAKLVSVLEKVWLGIGHSNAGRNASVVKCGRIVDQIGQRGSELRRAFSEANQGDHEPVPG